MQQFQKSKIINAQPDQVFAFLSDINNLPQYLPTVKHAETAGGDKIRIQGEAGGKSYDDTGFFRSDKKQRRMEWGSDGDSGYSGWLQVKEMNSNACEVVVHLAFDPKNEALQQMDKHTGNHEQALYDGMERTLQSIQTQCEGHGSKVAAAKHQ